MLSFLRERSNAVLTYGGLSLALVGLTLLLDRLGSSQDVELALLAPYLVLIALAGWWAGRGGALFTGVATIPLVIFFLLEHRGPQGRLIVIPREVVQLLLVLLAGLLLGWLLDRLRGERERAEAAAEAERTALRERDALLLVIAHDLRSPLTALKARLQMAQMALDREPPNTDSAAAALTAAAPQLDRVQRLLEDLSAAGQGDGSSLDVRASDCDLDPLLRRIAERWRVDAPGHEIVLELAGPLPVTGDADRLEQVLDNLIANAVKYGPPGGSIVLRGRVDGPEVVVEVADDGPGIPPDQQELLFERFYRRPEHRGDRQPGLGLGLYIARELVVAQGGRIWAEGRPGGGTTFALALPLRAELRPLSMSA